MIVSRVARGLSALLTTLLLGSGCGGQTPASSVTPSPAYSVDCRPSGVRNLSGKLPGPFQYETVVADDRLRDYRVYPPPAGSSTTALPLLILLHGSGTDAAAFDGLVHFQRSVPTAAALLTYPDGCDLDWETSRGSYDVHFVSQMIARLEKEYPVDRTRIYVAGFSAGAFMTNRLACDLAGTITAAASVAGSMWWADCAPTRPISILAMNGTDDSRVPYEGGWIDRSGGVTLPAAKDLAQRWASIDSCAGVPSVSQVGITQTSLWEHCTGAAVVRLDTIAGGHHTWFGAGFDPVPGEPKADTVIWGFFTKSEH